MIEETLEENFLRLLENAKKRFASLEEYINKEATKGYIAPFKSDYKNDDKDIIAFKVGQRRFLLVADIIPQTQYSFLNTFVLVRDNAAYPNFRLEPIEAMKITIDTHDRAKFVEEKVFTEKAKIGNPHEWKAHNIDNFNEDYFQQLLKYISDTVKLPENM